MGWVQEVARKLTGTDVAADAAQRAAETQAAEIRRSSENAAKAANDAAAQAAIQQAAAQQRDAANTKAAEALSKPAENPTVRLQPKTESAGAKKRRAAFGFGSSGTGVSI